MNKHQIRQLAKTTRSNRTLKEMHKLGDSIRTQLFSHFKFEEYPNILIYLSSMEKGEIDTWKIIHQLIGHNVFVPRINSDEELKLVKYDNRFSRNKYGIFECTGAELSPRIDLTIIPVMAFDTRGNRIGFGKGYFDSLLATLESKLLVGLCADHPHSGWTAESHDVAMDYVVTPDKVYKFNQ